MQSAKKINANRESTSDTLAITHKLLRDSNPEKGKMILNEQKQNLYTEAHMLFAAQIRSHERILIEMLHQQGQLIRRQDRYVQVLLQTQLQRQMQLEESLMLLHEQQLGITAAMKLAMPSQPSTTLSSLQYECLKPTDLYMESNKTDNSCCVSPLHGEDMTTNNEDGCNRIEKTYKEQLAILHEELARLNFAHEKEKSSLRMESRTMEHERQALKNGYEQQIWELKQHHVEEIEKLKIMYRNRNQHCGLNRVTLQNSFDESDSKAGSKIQILETVARILKNLCSDVERLRRDMHVKIETLKKDRIRCMEVRKKKLVLAAKRWKKAKSQATDEQRKLGSLLNSLDKQLCQLTARTLVESSKIHAIHRTRYSETQTSDDNMDFRGSTSPDKSANKQRKNSQDGFRSEDEADHQTSQEDCDSLRVYYSRSFDIDTPIDEADLEKSRQDVKNAEKKQTYGNQADPTTDENKNIIQPDEHLESVEQIFQRKISFLQNCMRKIRESDNNRRCQQERLRREQETMANLRRHIQQQSELVLGTRETYYTGRTSEDDTDPDLVAEINGEIADIINKDENK